jgi:hypothetical protein
VLLSWMELVAENARKEVLQNCAINGFGKIEALWNQQVFY